MSSSGTELNQMGIKVGTNKHREKDWWALPKTQLRVEALRIHWSSSKQLDSPAEVCVWKRWRTILFKVAMFWMRSGEETGMNGVWRRWSASTFRYRTQTNTGPRVAKECQKEIKSPTEERWYLSRDLLRSHGNPALRKSRWPDCRLPGWTWLFTGVREPGSFGAPIISVKGNSGPCLSLGPVSQKGLKRKQRTPSERREEDSPGSDHHGVGFLIVRFWPKGWRKYYGKITGICALNLEVTYDCECQTLKSSKWKCRHTHTHFKKNNNFVT